MNSQRGKASSNASRGGRATGQPSKSQTNARNNNQQARPKASPQRRAPAQASVAAAYASTQNTGKAQVLRNSVDSCRIVHRELVSSLVGTANFTVGLTLNMNPGLSSSFPWLATQALGWEKYEFRRLHVCAYTRTGSTTPGSILLSPDYDAADVAPVSETVASAYWGTVEDAPWKDIKLQLDPARLRGERFVRIGALAANQDVKTYDVANVFVCTTDGTAVNWSKVWVEYEVILMNPQLPPGGSSGASTLVAASTIAAGSPFGSAPVVTGSFALTAAAAVLSFSGLTLGAEYALTATSTGTVISAYAWSALTGVTVKQVLFGGFPAAATTGAASITFLATGVTSGSVTLSVTATTITATEVVLTLLSPAPSF